MNPRYYVASSDVHGTGVFAGRRFKKGDLIGYLEVEPLAWGVDESIHDIWIGDRWHRIGNLFRYLNHSRVPNVEVSGRDGGVRALRGIARGTELRFHYGEDWEDMK